MLFATERWLADSSASATGQRSTRRKPAANTVVVNNKGWWSGKFEKNITARVHEVDGMSVGHIRIWSFDLLDDNGFVNEVSEILSHMPSTGLIIDLRSNPGGLIWASERLLQLFTPNTITPTRFSMLASDVTRAMASAPQNSWRLESWRRSLEDSVANADPYSGSVPITPPERCNDVGQKYSGPVLCVVDANTYSAGDLFAAGFVDNRVGPLVCLDGGTGAGGANVWTELELLASLGNTAIKLDRLPDGITYSVAIRRATRSGLADGMSIEDIGVRGHFNHSLTRRDLTDGNKDMLAFCSKLLVGTTHSSMSVGFLDDGIKVVSEGVSRIDVYERQRPLASVLVDKHSKAIEIIKLPDMPVELTVLGFAGDILRQKRIVRR